MDFTTTTATELAGRVRRREISARELVDHALGMIDATDGNIGAFVSADGERALADAAALDNRLASGEIGTLPLAGIPLAVKDLEDAEGFRTTHGSRLFADAPAATADSPLVASLRAAGCIVVGKTNTPEDGHAADTVNAVAGRTANPVVPGRSPGGSSGGSAAALAAGMVPLATGSDGGGSIRIPAALCGFSGFKPTNGVLPTGPQPPGSNLLSTRGPMALRTIDTVTALAAAVGRPRGIDPFAPPAGGAIEALAQRMPTDGGLHIDGRPLRIAWFAGNPGQVDHEVAAVMSAAVQALGSAGADITECTGLFTIDPTGDWWTLWTAAMAARHGHRRGTPEWDLLWPEVQTLTNWGCDAISAADVTRALDGAWRINNDVVAAMGDADLLVTPTVAGQTPVAGELGTVNGATTPLWVSFTFPFNLSRHPAGSVRAGSTPDGLPVGLQIVGRHHDDATVLAAMAMCEHVLG